MLKTDTDREKCFDETETLLKPKLKLDENRKNF